MENWGIGYRVFRRSGIRRYCDLDRNRFLRDGRCGGADVASPALVEAIAPLRRRLRLLMADGRSATGVSVQRDGSDDCHPARLQRKGVRRYRPRSR